MIFKLDRVRIADIYLKRAKDVHEEKGIIKFLNPKLWFNTCSLEVGVGTSSCLYNTTYIIDP